MEWKAVGVSGGAGVGKGTVSAVLLELGGMIVQSVTDRPRRRDEGDLQYEFVTSSYFDWLKGGDYLANGVSPHGTFRYGYHKVTLMSAIFKAESDGRFLVFDMQAEALQDFRSQIEIMPVLLDAPDTLIEMRLRGRPGNGKDDIEKRLAKMRDERQVALQNNFWIIENIGDPREAAQEILYLMSLPPQRQSNAELNRILGRK